MPTAHGRVYCLSISNPFRYHAYHIISKWKDIVINKNHLFTSHWSLFSLLYSLEKPPVRFMTRLVRTSYHTSGNTPESPTTTSRPLDFISLEKFFHTNLLWTSSHLVEKSVSRDSNPKHICVFVCWLAPAALPVKLHTYNRPLTVSTRIYRAMRDTNTEPFYTQFQILCGTLRNQAHTSLMSLYTAFGWAVG